MDQPSLEWKFLIPFGWRGGRGVCGLHSISHPPSWISGPPVVGSVTTGQRDFSLRARQALYKCVVRSLQIEKCLQQMFLSPNFFGLTFVLSQLIKRILIYIVSVYCHINGWSHHKVMQFSLRFSTVLRYNSLEQLEQRTKYGEPNRISKLPGFSLK